MSAVGRDDSPSRPLLRASRGEHGNDDGERDDSRLHRFHRWTESTHPEYRRRRRQTQTLLISKEKHYLILGLVALDVMGILADIFIALIACDMGEKNKPWVEHARDGLQLAGLVFSCLFLVELVLCVWAFGFQYFYSWFHIFDGLVIIASFVIDLLARGVVEEIASLVIMLRLWRFVKIVEELSVGASERMEEIELKLEQLEEENERLKEEVSRSKVGESESGEQHLPGPSP